MAAASLNKCCHTLHLSALLRKRKACLFRRGLTWIHVNFSSLLMMSKQILSRRIDQITLAFTKCRIALCWSTHQAETGQVCSRATHARHPCVAKWSHFGHLCGDTATPGTLCRQSSTRNARRPPRVANFLHIDYIVVFICL